MKNLSIHCLSFCLLIMPLSAAETALSALQALKDTSRSELLAGLAEVKSKEGVPQPEEWIVLCNDPSAHGGIRELTITNGHIVSERTPMGEYAGEGDLPHLTVTPTMIDSGAIFKTVDREAKVAHLGFDSIDYVLRVDAVSGKPLWIVQLHKSSGTLAGTMEISAETGEVLKPLIKK
jgi:hypothetical protein